MTSLITHEVAAPYGHIGVCSLNRPEACHAVDEDLQLRLKRRLDQWAQEDHIAAVLIASEPHQVFSSGGDIKSLWDLDLDAQKDFFLASYRFLVQVAHYPKPVIVFANGDVYGGGVGLLSKGALRIGVKEATWAMPECGIGFFPDVGMMYYLQSLPKPIGLLLAFGLRITMEQAFSLGLVDVVVEDPSVDTLLEMLVSQDLSACLNGNVWSSPDSEALDIGVLGDMVDYWVSNGQWPTVLGREDVMMAIDRFMNASPQSLQLTYHRWQHARTSAQWDACLTADLITADFCLESSIFKEGARDVLQKEAPSWEGPMYDLSDLDHRLEVLFKKRHQDLFGGS